MSRFFTPALSALEPYVPGEQPQTGKSYIKLNTNESPYKPSPKVLDVLSDGEAAASLRLYCDPACGDLLAALATSFGVGRDQVFAGNGSDEVLGFTFLGLCPNGAVFPDISYGFYKIYSKLFGLNYTEIPLREDFTIKPEDYADEQGTVFIANPNAPTGIALSLAEIESILAQNTDRLVVVDEAYVAFGAQSSVQLLDKYDNLLVIGTFSKSRSLAGARLGYAVGSAEIIADLNRVKFSFNPYNINSLSQLAGCASLADEEHHRTCCARVIRSRERAAAELRALGFTLTDSKTNFIFAGCPQGLSAGVYQNELRSRGILVRYWNAPRIENYLRISIGTDKDMDALIAATKEILEVYHETGKLQAPYKRD